MTTAETPTVSAVDTDLEAQSLRMPLKNLYLDPSNYRFIDAGDYVRVPEEQLLDADVQRRTTRFILGDKEENVRDLLNSFHKNGWLHVDQIQVRRIAKGKFLVVEGNRRVAALKFLERRYEEAAVDLGSLKPEIFNAVPVNA